MSLLALKIYMRRERHYTSYSSPYSLFQNTLSNHALLHNSVRSPADLDTLLLLSASSRIPLITLWTASWCPSCRTVLPLVQSMIEDEGAGELPDGSGSVGFAEVEFDAPGNEELAGRYLVSLDS